MRLSLKFSIKENLGLGISLLADCICSETSVNTDVIGIHTLHYVACLLFSIQHELVLKLTSNRNYLMVTDLHRLGLALLC